MTRQKLSSIFSLAAIVVLVLSSAASRLNYASFDFGSPDISDMLPSSFLTLLLALQFILVVFHLLKKSAWMVTVAIVFLWVAFPIAQYPTVVGWDYYSHANTAYLLYSGTPIASGGYTDYPGAFLALDVFKEINGCPTIESALFLNVIIRAVSIVTLFIVGKNAFDSEYGYLAVSLFVLGNFRFSQYTQYSPQTIGILFFIQVLWMIGKPSMSRKKAVMLVLISIATVTTHPFSSLLLLMLATASFSLKLAHLGERKIRWPSNSVLLCLFVLWFGWQIFAATSTASLFARPLSESFLEKIDFLRLFESATTFTLSSGLYNQFLLVFRQYFFIFMFLSGIAGLYLGRHDRKLTLFTQLILGVALFSCILLLLQTPTQTWLDRALLFGYLPLSLLTAYFLTRTKIARAFRLCKFMAVIVIAIIGISFYASNEWMYTRSIHTWEVHSAHSIMQTIVNSGSVIVTDDITSIVFRYSNGTLNSLTINRHRNSPSSFMSFNLSGIEGTRQVYIVRSYRQLVDWYYVQNIPSSRWAELDQRLILTNTTLTKFYDSCYVQTYEERL